MTLWLQSAAFKLRVRVQFSSGILLGLLGQSDDTREPDAWVTVAPWDKGLFVRGM